LYPQATFHFPFGFLWGTATAAHQVEGNNNNNNWAAWEQEAGRIKNNDRAGLACDWWNGRWKGDFDRATETGQNAHRMSVEWSRIQPTPDHWDESALDYYREMVRGLRDRKITPLITLHHFSNPLWLEEQGAWENDETPLKFARFARKVAQALKEYVTIWTPINEPNVYTALGYLQGFFPPGKTDPAAAFAVLRNMLRGHAAAYSAIHEVQREARVGTAIHYRGFLPARPSFPPDAWLARFLSRNQNDAFPRALDKGRLNFLFKNASLREAAGTQDFIGVNYYTTELVRFSPLDRKNMFMQHSYPSGAPLSKTGFIADVPEGMFTALRWANSYGKPILILENGVEDADDTLRPQYLIEHLYQVWKAVNGNYPIKGYFHWTLVDNFEWERGWSQKFGLWGLNTKTQARIRRPSVDLYAEICRENGVSTAMMEKYAPQTVEKIFPE
jgi:beta-glucosidase